MTKQLFLLLFLLPAGIFAQQTAAKALNERYVVYPRTKANRILYDSTDTHGLHNLLRQTMREATPISGDGFRGIAPEHVPLVKKMSRYTLTEQIAIPLTGRDGKDSVIHRPDGIEEYVYPARDTIWHDISCRLEEQKTTPIENHKGGDSVIYLPDGTEEYVYPVRGTIFYSLRFDDIVVREQLRPDPSTGERMYVPAELLLRRHDPSTGRAIVTLGIGYDALCDLTKTLSIPLSDFAWKDQLLQHRLKYEVLPAGLTE